MAIRGIWAHRLGLQAAALTYYTVFSLVPLLVVALWILKAFGRLPIAAPTMPVATEMAKGNAALHSVLGRLLENLNHTSQVTSGVVGLVALLYTVVRLFMRTERALDLIALSTTRKPQLFRLFGYLALLLLPPLLGLVAGAIAGASHSTIGSAISRPVRLCRATQAGGRRWPGPHRDLDGHRHLLFGGRARPHGLLVSGGRSSRDDRSAPGGVVGVRRIPDRDVARQQRPVRNDGRAGVSVVGLLVLVRRAVRSRDRRGPRRRPRAGARRLVLPPRRRGGTGDRPRDHAAGHPRRA